jgi:hypothetical protein
MFGLDPRDAEWVVERRSAIQRNICDLYVYLDYAVKTSKVSEQERNACFLLIGVAFSLWRAVFLVDTSREWPRVLKEAKDFLEKVVRDNAINYQQDRETRAWSVGYYFNNAKYRLYDFQEKLGPSFKIASLAKFEELHRTGADLRDPKRTWDVLYSGLCESCNEFARRASVTMRPTPSNKAKKIENRQVKRVRY